MSYDIPPAATELRALLDRSSSDFMRYRAPLLAFIERRLQAANDTEDVLQETMIRAMLAQQAGPIENVRAFLYRIAANLSIDILRQRSVRERISGAGLDSPEAQAVAMQDPSPDQAIMSAERKVAFDAAVASLTERQRQCLTLSRIEGWAYPRIAAHLGCSPNTVYNEVKAAMKHIIARTSEIDL